LKTTKTKQNSWKVCHTMKINLVQNKSKFEDEKLAWARTICTATNCQHTQLINLSMSQTSINH